MRIYTLRLSVLLTSMDDGIAMQVSNGAENLKYNDCRLSLPQFSKIYYTIKKTTSIGILRDYVVVILEKM